MRRWLFYKLFPRIEICHQMELDLMRNEIFLLHTTLRRMRLILIGGQEREIRLRNLIACLERDISPKMLHDAEEYLKSQQDSDEWMDG